MHLDDDDTPIPSNAPDGPHRKPQTPKQVSDLIMDWLEQERFDFETAAAYIGISRSNLVNITNGYQFSDDIRELLARFVPGVNPP